MLLIERVLFVQFHRFRRFVCDNLVTIIIMKFSSVIVLLAAVVVIANAAGVMELTPDNFDNVVDGSRGVFIKFFAPWCGHCKVMSMYDHHHHRRHWHPITSVSLNVRIRVVG